MTRKSDCEGVFFLSERAPKRRLEDAANARKNRAEIVQAFSHGKVSRRELMKWGLITSGGLLAPIHGLSPYASAYVKGGGGGGGETETIPTGAPPSPMFGVQAFTQPMPRFDVLSGAPIPAVVDATHPHPLNPVPTATANQTQKPVDPALGGGNGPIEGRPPGAIWAHQRFNIFPRGLRSRLRSKEPEPTQPTTPVCLPL